MRDPCFAWDRGVDRDDMGDGCWTYGTRSGGGQGDSRFGINGKNFDMSGARDLPRAILLGELVVFRDTVSLLCWVSTR